MCNLTARDLQEHIDSLQDDYSYSTIKKCYEFFTAMIAYGIDEGDFPNKLQSYAYSGITKRACRWCQNQKNRDTSG